MDSFYIDQRVGDSRQSRSRASSHLSATAAQFQGLNITAPSSSVSPGQAHISRENTNTAPSYLDQESPRHSGSFVTSPLPQAYTPFPLITDDLDRNWTYASSYLASSPGHSTGTPVLRLDSASGDYLQEHHQLDTNISPQSNISPHSSNQSPSNMSALGIQNYDPRFDAGVRQSYTWPHLEMGNQYIPQNMSHSMSQSPGSLTPYDSNMPMYARSLSSSPPRAGLTPEQRELKRQREHARRDSKNRQRRDRSASNNSNPYIVSQSTTPDLMPRTLPEYQSNLTSAPLLQQPSPSLGSSPAFLSSYSPQLGNEPVQSDMYGPVFSMSPNDFTIPAYSMTYSNVGDASLHSYAPRPHSLSSASDAPSMYQSQSHASPPIGSPESGEGVRVVHSRPKPQCWEHGCNGRQFSTFSNLLRHQREKSGVATKSSCPHCGAEFTRTTARNGHMMHEKCKQQRRNS